MRDLRFPGDKRFAFTVIDDTDVATVANVRPMYRLLERLGMGATKTVWPVSCPEGSDDFAGSETLEDPEYESFVRELLERGFEVTWHGATMETSTRPRTLAALERYRERLGAYPRIHINHAYNRENLYWGIDRVDASLLRAALRWLGDRGDDGYQGAIRGSEYWWGDACERVIRYGRNLTFGDINVARINPSMPYRDPARPLVPLWFSSADADAVEDFNELLAPHRQARLERDGGFCIVATHFGKGFVRDGDVNATTRRRLEELSRRDGWFPTAGALLDWLRARRNDDDLPRDEWRRMQWRWAWDMVRLRLRDRIRRMQAARRRDATTTRQTH